MKKIISILMFCVMFLLLNINSKSEELADEIMNIEVITGKEKLWERVETMAHAAILMDNQIDISSYLKEKSSEDRFPIILDNLAKKKIVMNDEIYNYLLDTIDIEKLESQPYGEEFNIIGDINTTTELIDMSGKMGKVLRVKHTFPEKEILLDIPYNISNNGKQLLIEVYPENTMITLKKGKTEKIISISNKKLAKFYLITKALEELQYYEYDMMESEGNPPFNVDLEAIPRVTDENILNQSIAQSINSSSDKNLARIGGDYPIQYSSFDKKDLPAAQKYAYLVFFGTEDFIYRISCARNGILSLDVSAGSGNFLYYTIPNLENPYEIFEEHLEGNEEHTLLDFSSLDEQDEKVLTNIANIIRIFKEIPKETSIDLGI